MAASSVSLSMLAHSHPELVANWYYGVFPAAAAQQHRLYQFPPVAAVAAHVAVRVSDGPTRSKRRRTSDTANAQSAPSSVQAVGAADAPPFTRILQRGNINFKPYSDDAESSSGARAAGGSNALRTGVKRKASDDDVALNAHGARHGADRRSADDARDLNAAPHVSCRRDGDDLRGGEQHSPVSRVALSVAARQTPPTVNNLFPEILSIIFRYLDVTSRGSAARVCTRWRDAANRKSVWFGVEARLHLGKPNAYVFPSLVQRGIRRVQVLSLRNSLRELVNGVPNLESLNLSGCYNLTDSALEKAFHRDAPNLRHLNLSLCKEVSDNALGKIALRCRNLEVLELGGCTKVTNAGLLSVSHLPRIRKLNLRSCRQISDAGLGHVAGATDPAHANRNLEELVLQDCQKLTDEALRHIAAGLPRLRALNLSFCISVTDTGLKSVGRLRALETLSLRSCDNVSDIGVGFLCEDGGCGDSLRDLDVSFCPNVSDAGMKHVSAGMRRLRALSMTTCGITDEGLRRLCERLADLEVLNIGQCVGVTDVALAKVAESMRSLRSLDLYGCPKVTAAALLRLRHMPSMRRLNLEL